MHGACAESKGYVCLNYTHTVNVAWRLTFSNNVQTLFPFSICCHSLNVGIMPASHACCSGPKVLLLWILCECIWVWVSVEVLLFFQMFEVLIIFLFFSFFLICWILDSCFDFFAILIVSLILSDIIESFISVYYMIFLVRSFCFLHFCLSVRDIIVISACWVLVSDEHSKINTLEWRF